MWNGGLTRRRCAAARRCRDRCCPRSWWSPSPAWLPCRWWSCWSRRLGRGAAMPLPDDPEDLSPGAAAERTRLAWQRTAISFGAVGLVMLREEPAAGALVLAATPLI